MWYEKEQYEEKQYKYKAMLYIRADKSDVEFIGKVSGNSIKELKEKARDHAQGWDKHLFGRLYIDLGETGFSINP